MTVSNPVAPHLPQKVENPVGHLPTGHTSDRMASESLVSLCHNLDENFSPDAIVGAFLVEDSNGNISRVVPLGGDIREGELEDSPMVLQVTYLVRQHDEDLKRTLIDIHDDLVAHGERRAGQRRTQEALRLRRELAEAEDRSREFQVQLDATRQRVAERLAELEAEG